MSQCVKQRRRRGDDAGVWRSAASLMQWSAGDRRGWHGCTSPTADPAIPPRRVRQDELGCAFSDGLAVTGIAGLGDQLHVRHHIRSGRLATIRRI